MAKKLVNSLFAAALLLAHASTQAEDIDLFTGSPASDSSNVLFLIDNAANFSASAATCKYPDGTAPSLNGTIGGLQQCALYAVINNQKTNPDDGSALINVGMMAFNANGFKDWKGAKCDAVSSVGGCLMLPITPLTESNKTEILAWIKTWKATSSGPGYDIKTNSAATGALMQEAWAYFTGRTGLSGRSYAGMKPGTDCSKNYVIYVSGTAKTPNDQTGNAGPKNALEGTNPVAGMNASPVATLAQKTVYSGSASTMCGTTTFGTTTHENKGFYADEWSRYMSQTADIATTTIGAYETLKTCDPITAGLLDSMAKLGGGDAYLVKDASEMQLAIEATLSKIQSVDNAFASASLPVSVNTQGTYLNQIFIGMFRPEKSPRWFGNLKQYQFKATINSSGEVVSLTLADKTNSPAINSLNGFIDPCARSFWSTADTYWPSDYLGNCQISGLTDVRSNSPDGEIVEKGAVAQRLRAQLTASGVSDRAVYTCSACGDGATLESFSSGTASIAALGVADATEQTALIDWVRGANNKSPSDEAVKTATIRSSVHGDVVHSRPLPIDYGGTTGVVVFYGSNDGMLRAVSGNKVDSSGEELWGFVAPEHFGRFKRLRDNTLKVAFPGVEPPTAPKDYFFDGPISVYRGADTITIYATMRRGGSHIYAFDVTDPTAPKLKWKRGPSELSNVGQTWSEPKVVKVAGYPLASDTKSPLIIMGGGYDSCEDQDAAPNTSCPSSPKGNRVYVIDAGDGTVKKTLGLGGADGDPILRSIAADVTAVDSDGDGYVDVAYAVDTGANIYRIDIGNKEPANWTVKHIASLDCTSSPVCGRKFLHAPEVVVGTNYNAVLVGSGNRERPLLTNEATKVDNGFFMVKDDRTAGQALIKVDALLEVNPDVPLDADQQAELAAPTNKGWFIKFGTGVCVPPNLTQNCHDKEQVVTSAVVVAGVVYFSTHMPVEKTLCGAGNLGLARGYAVNFMDVSAANGDSLYSTFSGGGLPPSPVAGVVSVALTGADGAPVTNPDGTPATANVPFVIGGGGISGIDPSLVEVNPSGVRGRVYWYIQQ